jgi:PEP-CTERM motif
MRGFRNCVAASGLALLAIVSVANAQTNYDSSANWLSTYPTTTAINAATTSTWGTGSVWSAGIMSSQFANTQTTPTYQGPGYEDLTTYYSPTTSYLNSGATVVATYTSTVPFTTYQLNPGTTLNVNVGIATTEQAASTAKAWSGASNALTLPSSFTTEGAATGLVKEVTAVEPGVSRTGSAIAGIRGFDIVGYGTGSFKDGSTSIQDTPAGVFYNYNATNTTSSSPAAGNFPSSGGDALVTGGTKYDTVTMNPTFGPSYVAWTAPAQGTLNITMNAWDIGSNSGDGIPSFFVMNSKNGPTAPMFSALGLLNNGSLNGNVNQWTAANGNVKDTQGSIGYLAGLSGYNGTGSGYNGFGVDWTSGNITVSKGEIIYFVADPTRTATGNAGAGWWGEHAYEGYQDPVALNDSLSFVNTPEPSSIVLMAMAGAGLALAAWKRRRSAA